MIFILSSLLLTYFTGVRGSQSLRVPWIPCQMTDERVFVNSEGYNETQHFSRHAGVQFGEQAGDSRLMSNAITFLLTGSKVDMRRYVLGREETLQCEIRRHSTGGIESRWPGLGAHDNDLWFTCTLRHTEGLAVITTFLRYTPAPGVRWLTIEDTDTISVTAAMVVLTYTPSVNVGMLQEKTLNCQFEVDHKSPNLAVEWRHQHRGERFKLFSYNSREGKSEGRGVSLKTIAKGDASLKLPPAKRSSEGTYICSVYVPPLYGSHDIPLQIVEPPRVSLDVPSPLVLPEGAEQKVVCEAAGYYPLDVEMEWLKESLKPGSSLMPEVLKNVLYSSHRNHPDGTFSLSAFFLLKPSLQDSGYRYTCRVSHRSLNVPIRKSFILDVTEETGSFLWYVMTTGFIILIVLLTVMLSYLRSVRRESNKKKPY
ncbi:tapasin-related protein [Denticeps clupeoides]|uniref:Ig-like domain-containing protein n=1 Tax=Denticeps clupeoides TaxID=299321 RepID=A0AAY4C956_9TELE|nr:tapasin-related protein-like [Denticeps clupeoides]